MSNIRVIDDLGREISLTEKANRVVSLVPSLTETLIEMGVQVVGRTKFCLHPEDKIGPIPRIGGTKTIKVSEILALKPNLIVANMEENIEKDVMTLSNSIPVYVSNISKVDQIPIFFKDMSDLCVLNNSAVGQMIAMHNNVVSQMKLCSKLPVRVVYLIWKNPYMCAGNDTYIKDVLSLLGFEVIHVGSRYPQLELSFLYGKCDLLLLASEPYPFKDADGIEIMDKFGLPSICVSGESFSWYGIRFQNSLPYFMKLRAEIITSLPKMKT